MGLRTSSPTLGCSLLLSGTAGHVVPLRLRLLRQHAVAAEHPEGGDATRELGDEASVVACIFVVFAVPGYLLAVWKMDRIGHRRLQFIGFAVMALCFIVLAAVPVLTQEVAPFIAIFGLSYFFTEFGPNTTTFVLPSEVFPVSMRTTGHGIAAGIGKLGAFVGVFLVPQLQNTSAFEDCLSSRDLLPSSGSCSRTCSQNLPVDPRRCLGGRRRHHGHSGSGPSA